MVLRMTLKRFTRYSSGQLREGLCTPALHCTIVHSFRAEVAYDMILSQMLPVTEFALQPAPVEQLTVLAGSGHLSRTPVSSRKNTGATTQGSGVFRKCPFLS